jgi:peptidoglycan/LPS O-acetylase OafA/YrhL
MSCARDKVSLFQRSFTVDLFKVIAAQLIVWHHLCAYGPMADTLRASWPLLIEGIYDHARIAVQVFLVVAGFLAAQSVSTRPVTNPWASIFKRYVRLVPFYLLVIALISIAVALARPTIQGDWLPDTPTLGNWARMRCWSRRCWTTLRCRVGCGTWRLIFSSMCCSSC